MNTAKLEKKLTIRAYTLKNRRFPIFNWDKTYKSGEQNRIKKTLISLYARENWQELHVALWKWLAIDGERETWDWFETFGVPEVEYYSFACEMASSINPKHMCSACPLEHVSWMGCTNGFHDKWTYTHKLAERKELANEIANMKWNTSWTYAQKMAERERISK